VTRHLSVSEAARMLKARPRDISNLFYRRRLRDDLCPIVAGRRLIPQEYVEIIAAALRRAGLPCQDAAGPFQPPFRTDADGNGIDEQIEGDAPHRHAGIGRARPDSPGCPPVGNDGAGRATGCASTSADCGSGRKTASTGWRTAQVLRRG